MAKKRNPPKIGPIFRKEKEMLKLMNDPEGFKKLVTLTEKAQEIKPIELKKASSLMDWLTMCVPYLPDEYIGTDFTNALSLLVEQHESNNQG